MDSITVNTPPPIDLSVTAPPAITISADMPAVSVLVGEQSPVVLTVNTSPVLRILASSSDLAYPQVVSAASQAEETAAFLSGAKIVIRTDLL